MLACIPPLVIAGGTLSVIISRMSSRGQIAYAEAGNVVEQAVGSIRTVGSYFETRIFHCLWNAAFEIPESVDLVVIEFSSICRSHPSPARRKLLKNIMNP